MAPRKMEEKMIRRIKNKARMKIRMIEKEREKRIWELETVTRLSHKHKVKSKNQLIQLKTELISKLVRKNVEIKSKTSRKKNKARLKMIRNSKSESKKRSKMTSILTRGHRIKNLQR